MIHHSRAPQVALVAFLSDQRNDVTPVTILVDGLTTMADMLDAVTEAVASQHPHYSDRPIAGLRWFIKDNVLGAHR